MDFYLLNAMSFPNLVTNKVTWTSSLSKNNRIDLDLSFWSNLMRITRGILKRTLKIVLYGVVVWWYMWMFQSMNLTYDYYEDELYSSTNWLLRTFEKTLETGVSTPVTTIDLDAILLIMTSVCLEVL